MVFSRFLRKQLNLYLKWIILKQKRNQGSIITGIIQISKLKLSSNNLEVKMKRITVLLTAVLLLALFAVPANAQSNIKPIELSVWSPFQLYTEDTSIHGVRLTLIYGKNEDIHGVDWGLVHRVTGDFMGWQPGFVNLVDGSMKGFQEGFVNTVGGEVRGWQSGFVNINESLTYGLQTGFFNKTNRMEGVQFGFVNICESLHGIQIGLVNINNSGDPFKFMPIINWSF
jgi:hypothetical protein